MKKTFLLLALAGLMASGCSKTWSGIKQDSHEIFVDTKEAIHEATAPSAEDSRGRIIVSNNVAPVEQSMATVQNPVVDTQQAGIQEEASKTKIFTDEPTVVSAR